MKQNIELLCAIRSRGLRQRDYAKIVGVHESVLSNVVNGRLNLNESEKVKYARALGMKPGELFNDD